MYPKRFFAENTVKEISGRAFVIMPFDTAMRDVFAEIKRVLGDSPFSFDCIRSDDTARGGHILEDVLRGIAEAAIVIADLSGRNPNVFYELGIAHMVKDVDKIILIDQQSRNFLSMSARTGASTIRTHPVDLGCSAVR